MSKQNDDDNVFLKRYITPYPNTFSTKALSSSVKGISSFSFLITVSSIVSF
jgi:hypothetical protein